MIPDDCDICPRVRSYSSANCNEDAELAHPTAPVGDLCDATPCGETEIVALESRRAGATELRMGYVEVDGRSTERGAYPTGFRTCPCSAVAGDSVEGRLACTFRQIDLSGDCTISDLATYALPAEPRTWRWNTIDGLLNPEPVVPYAPHEGTFEADLQRRFDLRLDFDRWGLFFPLAYPHGAAPIDPDTDPIELLFWTRTLTPIREWRGLPFASDLVRASLANHYWSGEVAAPFTFGLPDLRAFVAAAGVDASACPACAAAFPAPFVIRPCPSYDPDCAAQTSLAFAGGSAEIEAVAPRLRAFSRVGVARWVSSTDAGWSRTPDGARFVGLAEGGTEIVSVLSLHNGTLFDELGHVCKQCLVSPFSLPRAGAVLPRPVARSGFATAMSGANGRVWMSGGVGASGEMLHDLWEADLAGGAWRELAVSRRSELGDVLAMVWSAPHRALYLLDAVGASGAGVVRLLRVPAEGEVFEVEQRWPRLERGARYALAVEPSGALWIVGSPPGSGEHVALRLVEPPGHAGHVVDAYTIGEGELVLEGVWASSRGLSVLVADADGVRPVGHVPADLRPGRGGASRCF